MADLAWCIGSPPLMSERLWGNEIMLTEEWFDLQWQQHLPLLHELQANPEPLEAWIREKQPKLLGKRFECLLSFWFHHSPFFKVEHEFVQLKHGTNTSAEIDFIIRDVASDELWHIEAACKYYLGLNNQAQWSDWWGPNGKDHLDLKIYKMEKQLACLESRPGKHFLKENGLRDVKPKALIKGYFFHHYPLLGRQRSPQFAHPHYSGGWFVRLHELQAFVDTPAQWLVLPKERWMSPFHFNKSHFEPMSGEELATFAGDHFRENKKALLVVQVLEEADLLREYSRGFILPA